MTLWEASGGGEPWQRDPSSVHAEPHSSADPHRSGQPADFADFGSILTSLLHKARASVFGDTEATTPTPQGEQPAVYGKESPAVFGKEGSPRKDRDALLGRRLVSRYY